MAAAIEAEGIVKTYRKVWWSTKKKVALKGVDLQVEEGEIFGILGPNGAGKTTLLSILSTLLLPDRGKVRILGIDGLRNGHRVREKVNISSGNANFLWSLTIRENLHFYGMLYGLVGRKRAERVESLIALLDLKGHQDVQFDRLSTGMKQRLSLAKCLLNDPEVLFLDEPTVGIDVQSRNVIINFLHELKKTGTTVIYTSHYMEEAEHLCTRVAIIDRGRIVTVGEPHDLVSANPQYKNLETVFLQLTGKDLRDA